LKILRLLQDQQYAELRARTVAAVLLSPFDMVAFNGGVGDELRERRAMAQRLMARQGDEALVTTDIFDAWPLSVKTYLEATTAGGRWDLLPTREKSAGAVGNVDLPTLVAIGGSDFASYPNPATAAEIIGQQVPTAAVAFMDGAPHNFAGHEDLLAKAISNFLRVLPDN
jgi:hypothetical protein